MVVSICKQTKKLCCKTCHDLQQVVDYQIHPPLGDSTWLSVTSPWIRAVSVSPVSICLFSCLKTLWVGWTNPMSLFTIDSNQFVHLFENRMIQVVLHPTAWCCRSPRLSTTAAWVYIIFFSELGRLTTRVINSWVTIMMIYWWIIDDCY